MVPEPAQPPMGADWLALKNAVRRFEDAWRAGPRPQIDEFLPAGAGLRCRLLVELVHIDLELRLKAGEAARAEEYLAAFPELAAERARLLELIAAEHEFRRRRERGILVTEYRQRFPQLADEICEIFELATVADGHAPPGPESADEPVPAVAGYAVLGPLGRGGMGVVYAARQLSLDRPVALKFLPAECARDPAWLERFRHEARAASGLNHPNICTIYDTGDCAGRPYLSMELIQGATLEPLIGQRRPARELAGLIAQAARALAAAHAAGVVHRDIKPQNIMVRADGIVKVLDFGLARRLPGAGSDTARHETERGQRVGTIMYMSPEQARAETVDGASDLFSLGLVLYELATGMHPFAADSRSGVLHAIIAHTPAPAACGNPEIPEAMDRLLMQMLAKQSRHRPTAAQVAAELADVAENRLGYAVGVARPRRRATVGRSDERRTLRNAFAAAAAGYGAMVCVTGEAGLGKTTLVEDFLDELTNAGQPVTLARGHCSERLAGTEAYLPVLEALDTLLLGANSAAAAQLMNRVAPSWHVQLAPMATDEPSVGGMTAGAGEAPQERRKRELALFLQELARQRTVVLWLDDVHWADPSTIDLLAYLGNKCAGQRWLLVLTYRPSDLLRSEHPFGPAMLELQARRACREIPLPFLSRADLDSYLSLTFAGHQFPDEFAAVIHARTEGNPLFMVELLQYLSDQGVLVQDRAHWSLLQRAPDLQRELPASVRGMIQRKVDRLDEADRRLLMAASVQGTEFDSAIVAAVLELGAAEVEESLEVLASRHALVRRIRPHEFPDGTLTTRYGFVHVLYQNALYAALQPTRRAAWSGAAAEALLIHYGEQVAAVTTELALLYETARNPACAVDYFLLAARNAVRLFAHREAVALARRGLGLLQTLPDGGAPQRQELPLLLALGVSLVATQGFASREVEATYSRARDLCQRGGDIASSFAVLYGLWNLSLLRCDFTACEELAGQMFALAHGQTDPQFLVMAHNAMQEPPFHRGDLAVARSHQELGLILYEAHRPRTLTAIYGEDPGVSFLMYGALTLWLLGYPEQAVRSCESAQALATELGNPFNVARALYFSALTSCWRRDATSTDDLANRLMTLAKEHGFALLYAGATILRGWCLAIRDEVTSGLELMHKGLTDWQATGAVSHRPLHLALLAETLIRCGRRAEALVIVSEALSVAAATREQFWEAELHRLRGELLCDGTDAGRSQAEECLHTGLGIARRQQARSLELRSAVSLSRLYQATGRRAAAHALLGETCAWFSEGSRTGDLTEANAMLNELS